MNDGKDGLDAREARHDGCSNAGIVMELMQTSLFDILYRKPVAWHLHEQLQVRTRSSARPYARMHACPHASHSSSSVPAASGAHVLTSVFARLAGTSGRRRWLAVFAHAPPSDRARGRQKPERAPR